MGYLPVFAVEASAANSCFSVKIVRLIFNLFIYVNC